MSEKHRVPVFDPESKDLRKVPLKKLNGLLMPEKFGVTCKADHMAASEYDKVEVSRWRRKVDVYESNDVEKDSSHAVVTGPSDGPEGKSFLARLHISRLGVASDVQRFVFSKNRILYIGAMPDL